MDLHTTRPPLQSLHSLHCLPRPRTSVKDDVLIKISHCGFNAGVVFIIGLLPSWLRATPAIPELDLSGTIVASMATSRTDL
jgi:NADPH:quinone reductase-like Zn-dependent oxidoreductase